MRGQEFAESHSAVNLRGVDDEVIERRVGEVWLGERSWVREGRVEPLRLAQRLRYFIRRRGGRDSWGNAIKCLSSLSSHSLSSLSSPSIGSLDSLRGFWHCSATECSS